MQEPAITVSPQRKSTETIRPDPAGNLTRYAGQTFTRLSGRIKEGNIEHRLAIPDQPGGVWVADAMTVDGSRF